MIATGHRFASAKTPATTESNLPAGQVQNDEVAISNPYGDLEVYRPPPVPVLQKIVVDTVAETRPEKSLAEELCVRFGENMPTTEDDKNPQRDVANFPRPKRLEEPEGTRLIIVPESWFAYFYDKTGVTGPYVLTAGLLTFLLSKEWLIIEHEMVVGASLAVIATVVLKKFGPAMNEYLAGMTTVSLNQDIYLNFKS